MYTNSTLPAAFDQLLILHTRLNQSISMGSPECYAGFLSEADKKMNCVIVEMIIRHPCSSFVKLPIEEVKEERVEI